MRTLAMLTLNLALALAPVGAWADDERSAAAVSGATDTAQSLNDQAVSLHTTGRYAEAEPLYREALPMAQAAGQPEVLWTLTGHLSFFYAAQGQRHLAIFFGDRGPEQGRGPASGPDRVDAGQRRAGPLRGARPGGGPGSARPRPGARGHRRPAPGLCPSLLLGAVHFDVNVIATDQAGWEMPIPITGRRSF
jgi:hypothetical protein